MKGLNPFPYKSSKTPTLLFILCQSVGIDLGTYSQTIPAHTQKIGGNFYDYFNLRT